MTVTLPYEVLRAILDVYADDGATLHSCILINKNWFAIAIQYLWAKPFNLMCKNARSYKKSDRSKRAANLLQSFVECITTFDAVFEKTCLHNKKSDKKSPLDYSEYVKELNWTDVCSVVWSLSRLDTAVNSIHADKDSRVECITVQIIAMAVQYCTELQFLSLEPRELSTHNYLQNCFASIKSLPRLRHFAWGSSMSETDALCQLATIAQNLESVTINHCHQNVEFISENIALLVQSQHRLKSFTVKHGDLEMHAILDLLQVCANSLESITFSGVVLRQNQETESVQFFKLKCIKIDTCTHISSSSWEPLLAADFPNLKEFVCKTHDSKVQELTKFIYRHGGSLTTLLLTGQRISDTCSKAIIESCHNLTSLSVSINAETVFSIARIIANLPKLHSVVLTNSGFWYEQAIDLLFSGLSKYWLPNLYHLELKSVDSFQTNFLERFLSKSNPPLRSLVINNRVGVTEECLNLIIEYLYSTLEILKVGFKEECISESCIQKVKSVIKTFELYEYHVV